ncbi:autotransporter-associated N-terminal domain-containing protein [uncultured Leptotrichia sp.]|uniref:autotransporter-associated N-terminal domain-containing protein n=1 Tax=uncultured Leptotrichia sp. TaxID=159271 RepID=UPI00261294E4|nr:autotransporter-associated N-terminal domain-containing protein [uncultured Leptotrichia sp.]
MTNNIRKIKQDLRAYAKRCKDVHYTEGLLKTFLVTGTLFVTRNLFSASENTSIASQKQEISTSIKTIHQQVKATRKENDKLLKNTNLELIQLMEQGDHVVKSPWSSWQFGMNYMYNDWHGHYKGRGDKEEKYPYEGIFERSTNAFERYTSPLSNQYKLLATSTNPYSASSSARTGLNQGYGIASTTPKSEPLVALNVEASIRPKNVQRDPVTAPTVSVNAPQLQALNVPNLLPPSLDIKAPEAVSVPNKTPNIVLNPTVQYNFDGHTVTGANPWGPSHPAKDQDGQNKHFWSGWNPATGTVEAGKSAWKIVGGAVEIDNSRRIPNVFYANAVDRSAPTGIKWTLKNAKVDVVGDPTWNPKGTSAVHAVWDGDITNVQATLHGYATFIAAETWHDGKVTINSSKVNIENSYNSVFFGFPATYYAMGINNNDYHSYNQRGEYSGDLKVSINNADNNYIYSIMGVQGSFKLDNSGDYDVKGNGNLVYLGIGYSPNWENLKGSGDVTSNPNTAMTPSIKLGTSGKINVDGNSNVGLFFENRYSNFTTGGNLPFDSAKPNFTIDKWKKSVIGIYQGEIEVGMKVGENSASNGNVGVYSRSGQREGIVPSQDLGAPDATDRAAGLAYVRANQNSTSNGHPDYDTDKIHNLEVAKAEIYFGKHATNSIMFAADNGSVIDVANTDKADKNLGREAYKEVTPSTEIKDSAAQLTSSYDDTVNQAATGTVIAYATGTWSNQNMPGGAATLNGKGSEINLFQPVIMSGRAKLDTATNKMNPSVALIGDNKGIVNAKKDVTANGYGSIVALAQNNGEVNVTGKITAKDSWAATDAATKPYLYTNIGAYASANSTVNIKEHDIHGIGAVAAGAGAKVVVDSTKAGSTIRTGKEGALAALNGGNIEYKGGTITHEDNQVDANGVGDHASSTPFNADANSHINFTGDTQLNIGSGILMPGTAADYAAAAGTTAKYNGMSNVDVALTGDNVILSSNDGITTTWTGAPIGSVIQTDMKVRSFNDNGHSYKIYYINGNFIIDSDIDLDSPTDAFKNVGLSREVVTINAGKTISSTAGKGLAMASNDKANTDADNSKTQYINNGTVNITGGSLGAGTIGLNISYGQINNNSDINVDEGIGAYGINGSTLKNDGNITISNKGVGMAAFTSLGTALQTYGTDKLISSGTLGNAKTLEIINNGTVTVNGNNSVGLYGELNKATGAPGGTILTAANGSITNNGKIVMSGDNAVGIVSKGTKVTLTGTGSSDIVVGKDGIGVYAENTPVTINSDYGIEVKENGTGIFVKNGSDVLAPGKTLELKYSGSNAGTGVGLFYEGAAASNIVNGTNVKLVDTVGTTGGLVGIYANNGGKLTNTADITGDKGYGIITNGTEIENTGNITLNNPIDPTKSSVGIFTQGTDKITNSGNITAGGKSVGIYGHAVDQLGGSITVGDGGTGIFSGGGNVNLSGGSITVGAGKATAVYTNGSGQTVTLGTPGTGNGTALTIGDTSFGFINEGTGNTIYSYRNVNQNLGNDSVYIYSKDASGRIENYTPLTSNGDVNYGLYGAGTIENHADMNFGTGLGNVGIYSIDGGTARNHANITVGGSDTSDPNVSNHKYAIGMAAGYGEAPSGYTGNIENVSGGVINVNGEYSIGMYGSHAGTTVTNNGTINLNASNTTGMYLDNGAKGINNGTIQSNGSGLKNVTGIVVRNGSELSNNGTINIDAVNARGIITKGNPAGANPGVIKNYGTLNITGNGSQDVQEATGGQDIGKSMGGVSINAPAGSSTATITVNGKPVVPELATTSGTEYKPMEVSTIGMYIDTSSKRFTNPVTGLNHLSGLTQADLIVGTEATENTTSKYIQINDKILAPYNQMILNNPQIEKWNVYAGSLTWMASIAQNQTTGVIENAYLAKVPYTQWAGKEETPINSSDTYNFLDGLEQRYGVEGLGTREKALFDKLNSIGKNEEILFYQATDEMMGHQYGNLQQRINATGNILDKEFRYLKHDWRNPSKQNNKIKVFGARDEYNTDTAGIIDYTSNAYGVAYVHEDEKIKMGNSDGWYAGVVTNRFKFKDIGHSRENQTQLKAGIFKTMSPKTDHNGALQWTIGGDVFFGINNMKRKYLVVDDIFQAKSDYNSYGAALKTDLGYDIRMSERTHLRPYGALKMEYGRFNTIKEDNGEMRLEVKGNDYFSVKPEVGMEFRYVQPLAVRTNLTVGLSAAYENELGKMASKNNQGRVRYTSADWFGIRGEKEDRRGNGKFDLNIGVDNTRFGVTVNGGYDTKGKNVRAGIGFRAIY